MKLCQTLQDLVMLALHDENSLYEVSMRETNTGHNDMEDVIAYRYLFIDHSPSFIRATQFQMKRGLDSVDMLEQSRREQLLPTNNFNVPDLATAFDRADLDPNEVEFIQDFFNAISKKDYQILVMVNHGEPTIGFFVKEDQDTHIFVKFTVSK